MLFIFLPFLLGTTPPPPPLSGHRNVPERAGTFCRNVVILGGSMFFNENACCYCQPLSSTLPVTLLFIHPLAEMLKCCFCGSEGASMTDFHDLQLKEQLLLQQKWEDDVDVNEGIMREMSVIWLPMP